MTKHLISINYLQLQVLMFTLIFLFYSCGIRTPKPLPKSRAHSQDLIENPIIITFNDDCQKGPIFSFPLGVNPKIHINLLNVNNPTLFSIGYITQTNLNIRLNHSQLTIWNAIEGNYGIELLLRSKAKCKEYQKQDTSLKCDFVGEKLNKKLPIDISHKIAIGIYNNKGLTTDPNGLGQGGGIVSDILRGEGFISFIIQFFGNNFLSNNINTKTQSTNMFSDSQVKDNPYTGKCANGILPDNLQQIN